MIQDLWCGLAFSKDPGNLVDMTSWTTWRTRRFEMKICLSLLRSNKCATVGSSKTYIQMTSHKNASVIKESCFGQGHLSPVTETLWSPQLKSPRERTLQRFCTEEWSQTACSVFSSLNCRRTLISWLVTKIYYCISFCFIRINSHRLKMKISLIFCLVRKLPSKPVFIKFLPRLYRGANNSTTWL